ncbi:MAG: NAD(P)-binding domain-containing protein [Bacilli bacterium]|nr:NAD(P)-binding domain-containing protein [Bacilli bacterium]
MKICILGTGVYGIALSKVLNNGVNEINMWTALPDEAVMLNQTRINPALENIKIDDNIDISSDLENAIKGKDALLLAIPTKYLNSVFVNLKDKIDSKQYIIIASKGLDDDKNDFLSNTLRKFDIEKKLGFISGPTFAKDLANGDPGVVTAAAESNSALNTIERMFENTNIGISRTNDIYGVQLLGTVKNVMAIVMGMSNSLNLNETPHTKLLMKMLDEVKQMLQDFGGQEKTLMEYAGIGDIMLTCLNDKSRNYTFGKLLASYSDHPEIIEDYKKKNTIEGLSNLEHLKAMIDERNKSYDFINMLYEIIHNNGSIDLLNEYLGEVKTKKM